MNTSRRIIRPRSTPFALVLFLLALLGAFGSISHKAEAENPFAYLSGSDSQMSYSLDSTLCTSADINLFSASSNNPPDFTGAYVDIYDTSVSTGAGQQVFLPHTGHYLLRATCTDGGAYSGVVYQIPYFFNIPQITIPSFGNPDIASSSQYQAHFNVDNNVDPFAFDPSKNIITSIQIVRDSSSLNIDDSGYAYLVCEDSGFNTLKTVPDISEASSFMLKTTGVWTSDIRYECPTGTEYIQLTTGGDETWWYAQVQIATIGTSTSMIKIDWTQPYIAFSIFCFFAGFVLIIWLMRKK